MPRRPLFLLLVGSVLSACTGVQIEDQSLQFNQASGSIGTRLMLLNALRAAKGYPLQFSRLTSYVGQGTMDGGVNLDIPVLLNTFGSPSGARALGSPAAQRCVQDGFLATATGRPECGGGAEDPAHTGESDRLWVLSLPGLAESAGQHHSDRGRSSSSPRWPRSLRKASNAACGPDGSTKKGAERLRNVCAWLEQVKECRDATEIRASPEGDVVRVYSNNPGRHCQYTAFQAFLLALRVLPGVVFDVIPALMRTNARPNGRFQTARRRMRQKARTRPRTQQVEARSSS